MRKFKNVIITALILMLILTGCGQKQSTTSQNTAERVTDTEENQKTEDVSSANENISLEGTEILLDQQQITVDGVPVSTKQDDAVYTGDSIVYYQEGQPETYGEGSEAEAHTSEEASQNTVLTITKPGTYILSGKLDAGQIRVDLGEDAKDDPEAVVTLVLNGAEINCDVAPAILFDQVYECGSDDADSATSEVDTSKAGANLYIADGSVNVITGSHVAKIYKEGTTQEEIDDGSAKKAYKYDAAIECMMSVNINAGPKGDGKLTVYADNEGIETKLHMTINGGNLTVNANDDSLNAGEDGVSVITINGGILTCDSGYGDGEEGDGIDSNGFIVMNGGYVIACANAVSQDSGVDSDMGIYLNGGTLLASGHMYDEISADSKQRFVVLSYNQDITQDQYIMLTDTDKKPITAFQAVNDYSIMVYSSPLLTDGDYNLYRVSAITGTANGSIYTDITEYTEDIQLGYSQNAVGGFMGAPMGEKPEGEPPQGMQKPEGEQPQDMQKPDGEIPQGMQKPDGEQPQDMQRPEGEQPQDMQRPDGEQPQDMQKSDGEMPQELSGVFTISADSFQFSGISELKEAEL